jgi:hypothetical protein
MAMKASATAGGGEGFSTTMVVDLIRCTTMVEYLW